MSAGWARGLGDVAALVRVALREDLAGADITAQATVAPGTLATASLVAKQALVLAGIDVLRAVFAEVDPALVLSLAASDGERIAAGREVARVRGDAHAILAAERTALNFVQRLSGVATLTRRYADAAGGRCRIADTRKTTPGLRALERHAVRCGGGHNHRNDLASAVLIKENHIRCAGGIASAIAAARARAPHTSRIECEVTSLDELGEALQAGADVVLLDNMDDPTVALAVERVAGRAVVEVSGGVTLDRVPRLAALGVDVISVGALTHSAPAADLSLLVLVDPR